MYVNPSEAITKRQIEKVPEINESLIELKNEFKLESENTVKLGDHSFDQQINNIIKELGYDKLTPPKTPKSKK